MSRTLICIHMSRTVILLLTGCFIVLSSLQMMGIVWIPWPTYPALVAIMLDLVLVIGMLASLTQHLKTLILFSWLIALTFLLIFFGNTVSTQYQSDLIGMFYLLLICIFAFTHAVCIIKYRMPCEENHHLHGKCSQQQLFEQTPDTLLIPPPSHLPAPPPPQQQQQIPGSLMTSPSSPLPPLPLNSHNCYAVKSDPQFHAV